MKKWGLTLAASIGVLALAGCGAPGEPGAGGDAAEGDAAAGAGGSRLQTVLDRGELICGVDGGIPGFSFVEDGAYSGLDVDVCKAVAAALFDDPEAVVYRNLDSTERFEALKGGEVDMLSRNTTWTISR
ncbi:MAG: transporter substrate-binding domain-containing protein, partial [Cyanobacteria bacterium P01_C01_bin.121]